MVLLDLALQARGHHLLEDLSWHNMKPPPG